MDALQFFLGGHEHFHRSMQRWLSVFTDEQIRWRPPDGGNSIIWLLWHITRCEDVAVNRFVVDRRQVLDDEEWMPRLTVSRRDFGVGMTDEEVDEISARMDIAALKGYLASVGSRTREIAQTLRPEMLDEVNDPAYVRRVLYDEGVIGQNANWVEEVCQGANRAYFLRHWTTTHSFGHAYQMLAMRPHFGIPTR